MSKKLASHFLRPNELVQRVDNLATEDGDLTGPPAHELSHQELELHDPRKQDILTSRIKVVLAKKTVKNQITLPKSIVERLPKTDYFEVSLRGDEILLRPVVIETKGIKLDRIRKKIKALGLTEKDVDAAIRWARAR